MSYVPGGMCAMPPAAWGNMAPCARTPAARIAGIKGEPPAARAKVAEVGTCGKSAAAHSIIYYLQQLEFLG